MRIDAVHYCELEEVLAEKRKRRSFLNRNAEPEDTAKARLTLLCRTLRDDNTLDLLVKSLKVPYMTRESCKVELARTISVLPKLQYVDLPEGCFTDDPSCSTLRQEVQARCPDIRKMGYHRGGERNMEILGSGRVWPNLEVLELTRLNMDPTVLRRVLGMLPLLRTLKVSEMQCFDDTLFADNVMLPSFPPLTELALEETHNITAQGLAVYLSRPDTRGSLSVLKLSSTGITPASLHLILSSAPSLQHLSIIESVRTSFPADPSIPLLASRSLTTMHYEITSSASENTYGNASASYYTYLTSSLLSFSLPDLRVLYVRDADFPESLLVLAPPALPFAADSPPSNPNRLSSNNPFRSDVTTPPRQRRGGLRQPLEVYSKGADEMEWNFARVQPPSGHNRAGSVTPSRPISSYGVGNLSPSWGGGARRSVIVGNGFGGFLAVPAEEGGAAARPGSSAGEHGRRGSQFDMWR